MKLHTKLTWGMLVLLGVAHWLAVWIYQDKVTFGPEGQGTILISSLYGRQIEPTDCANNIIDGANFAAMCSLIVLTVWLSLPFGVEQNDRPERESTEEVMLEIEEGDENTGASR